MSKPGTAKATGAPREILAGLVDIIKQQQKMIDNLAERLRQIEATSPHRQSVLELQERVKRLESRFEERL